MRIHRFSCPMMEYSIDVPKAMLVFTYRCPVSLLLLILSIQGNSVDTLLWPGCRTNKVTKTKYLDVNRRKFCS